MKIDETELNPLKIDGIRLIRHQTENRPHRANSA